MTDFKEIALAAIRDVSANREEILRAFVAKYGFEPDEAVQVQQGGKWWVEKRVPNMTAEELREAASMFDDLGNHELANRFEYYAKRLMPITKFPLE